MITPERVIELKRRLVRLQQVDAVELLDLVDEYNRLLVENAAYRETNQKHWELLQEQRAYCDRHAAPTKKVSHMTNESPGKCEDLHGNSKVEEAMAWLESAVAHTEPGTLRPEDWVHLAVLRAAIQPKRVTREWRNKWAIEMALEGSSRTYDDIIYSMLRELGVVVEDK